MFASIAKLWAKFFDWFMDRTIKQIVLTLGALVVVWFVIPSGYNFLSDRGVFDNNKAKIESIEARLTALAEENGRLRSEVETANAGLNRANEIIAELETARQVEHSLRIAKEESVKKLQKEVSNLKAERNKLVNEAKKKTYSSVREKRDALWKIRVAKVKESHCRAVHATWDNPPPCKFEI